MRNEKSYFKLFDSHVELELCFSCSNTFYQICYFFFIIELEVINFGLNIFEGHLESMSFENVGKPL